MTDRRKKQVRKEQPRERVRKELPRATLMMDSTELLEMLGVHKNTLQKWINEGQIPYYTLAGSRNRSFKREEIMEWIERFRHPVKRGRPRGSVDRRKRKRQ